MIAQVIINLILLLSTTATNMKSAKTIVKKQIKVAICGGGISGSIAANVLSRDRRFEITIFEAGRGGGGRSSTRRSGDFMFDHGY